MLQYILKNPLIKISNSYRSYLKMTGSYHWVNLKGEYELMNDIFFQWVQLKHAIPTIGKH